MREPTHVLIITHDDVLRNLLEQVFLIRSIQIVIAATVNGAEAIASLWGWGAFGLIIVDTEALGEGELDQQHIACHVLEEWTTATPSLPFIFLGTLLQKHALHLIRADGVRILVRPFRLDELVEVIDDLYGEKQHSPHP